MPNPKSKSTERHASAVVVEAAAPQAAAPQVIVQDFNQTQTQSILLEKSLEVFRIETKQELESVIARLEKEVKEESSKSHAMASALERAVLAAVTKSLMVDPDMVKTSQALTTLFGQKCHPRNLIQCIYLSGWKKRNEVKQVGPAWLRGSEVRCVVRTTFDAPVGKIATAAEGWDENDSTNEFYYSVRVESEVLKQVQPVTQQEEFACSLKAKLRDLKDQLDNLDEKTETMKAQCLRHQLASAGPDGQIILDKLDQARAASQQGYARLLGAPSNPDTRSRQPTALCVLR